MGRIALRKRGKSKLVHATRASASSLTPIAIKVVAKGKRGQSHPRNTSFSDAKLWTTGGMHVQLKR